MLALERQREVLRYVRVSGVGSVHDLARAVGASPSTIRRDLEQLNDLGLLTRVYGGASLPDNAFEVEPRTRRAEHLAEKKRIGRAGAALVGDNATILITGGTTTLAMLPFLAPRIGVTVLTNGLNIAVHLARLPEVTVVVLGGMLRRSEMSLLGTLPEQAIEGFSIDAAFVGTYGLDAKAGLTGASVLESGTDRHLLEAVDSLIVLADSSKFLQRGPARIIGCDRITTLITDSKAPKDAVAAMLKVGVDVTVV